MSFSDSFLKPSTATVPVFSKDIQNLFKKSEPDTYDVGQSSQQVIFPQVDIANDVSTTQTIVFEVDGRQRLNTWWDTRSMVLTANIKIVKEDGTKPSDTTNASTANNSLISLIGSAGLIVDDNEIEVIEQFGLVNQIWDMFHSTKEDRVTVNPIGGAVFDKAGQMNYFKSFDVPNPSDKSNPLIKPNPGYLARQKNFCNPKYETVADVLVPKWKWNETPQFFAKRLKFTFNQKIPPGRIIRIVLVYDGRWEKYFLSDDTSIRLKPHVTNLALRIQTYNVNPSRGLQLMQKFEKEGLHYNFNATYVDKLFMSRGGTVYQTAILNKGLPFSRMVLVFVRTKALTGSIDENPYNFKLQGFKGTSGNKDVFVQNVQIFQNGHKMNDFFHAGNRGPRSGFQADYLRTYMLAGGFEQKVPLFTWTLSDFSHGYGTQFFTCESLQSNVGSTVGRTVAGPVVAQVQMSGTLDEEVTAVFVTENSMEMHMTKTAGTDAVSVTTKRRKLAAE